MARHCVVLNCTNAGTHCFPKNESRRAQWIEAIKQLNPGLTIRTYYYICSAHFRSADFSVTPTSLIKLDRAPKRLKSNAIPSIFPWNQSIPEATYSPSPLKYHRPAIRKTYSRMVPIKFVEMPPFLDIQSQTDFTDPLQLPTEQIASQETETLDLNKEIKKEINRKEFEMQDEIENVVEGEN